MEASDAFATVGIGLLLSLSPTLASAAPLDSKFQPDGNLAASVTVSFPSEDPRESSPYPALSRRIASPRPGSEAYNEQIRAMLYGDGPSAALEAGAEAIAAPEESEPALEAIAPAGTEAPPEVESLEAEDGEPVPTEVEVSANSPEAVEGSVREQVFTAPEAEDAIAEATLPPEEARPIPLTEAIAPPEIQPPDQVSQQPIPIPATPPANLPTTSTDFLPEVESFVENLEQYPVGAEVEFPDYLEPSPNPLYRPTFPEEVELEGIQPITLQQAIALAERNNPELETVRLQLRQRRAELQEQRAELLPDLTLGSSLTASEGEQQEVTDFFGNSREVGDDVDVIFGGNVRIDYDIYTSGRRSALIDAAEQSLRIQELQVESQAEQLRLDVSEDYFDLQRADEQLRIRRDALNQALQNLRDAQALERAGVGTRFDVLQAEVDVANRQQELVRSLSDQLVARRQLAEQLNLDQNITLAAADPVAVNGDWELALDESIVLAYRNRAELQQQLLQREVNANQRRAAVAQYGPQVSAFTQYAVQDVLSNDDTGLTDDWTLGLQLDWRLFDGGAARAQARQQEIGVEIAEANFEDARNTIRFQVEQAFYNLQANETNIATAQLNVERARESLRLARLRFQAGVGTQSDVLRAQTELTQAEFNLVEAILGYNEALAQLRRSVSNQPSNDLSDRP